MRMNSQWTTCMRTIVLGVTFATAATAQPAVAAEVLGEVIRVEGDEILIAVDGDVSPSAGTPVDVLAPIPGLDQEARVARGRVIRSSALETVARIEKSTGKIRSGQKVRFLSDPNDESTRQGEPPPGTPVWAGVQIADLDTKTAEAEGLEIPSGAVVLLLVPNGPAAAAGVRVGDIIRRVADRAVEKAADFQDEVRRHSAGDTLRVDVMRKGRREELAVTLAPMPSESELAKLEQDAPPTTKPVDSVSEPFETSLGVRDALEPTKLPLDANPPPIGARPWIGVKVTPLSKTVAEEHRIDPKRGVHVQYVLPSSPAATAGLQPGDLLLAINGNAVPDVAGFIRRIEEHHFSGDVVLLEILRRKDSIEVPVTLGARPNDEEFRTLVDLSASRGESWGLYELGARLLRGDQKDVPRALDLIRKAADNGYPDAQAALGAIHRQGTDVPRDDMEALRWYRLAAEQGQVDALVDLGWMHEKGRGVPVDFEAAVKYYESAAESGYPIAQSNLGHLYLDGRGVKQDDAIAFQWFERAAQSDYAPALNALAWMNERGRGVPRNLTEAVALYRRAADLGNTDALVNLGFFAETGRGMKTDHAQALAWYQKAAESNNPRAQLAIGNLHLAGKGIAKDDFEARRWFLKAVEQDSADAQFNLGMMDELGRGGSQDLRAAVKWYHMAAKQGHSLGQYHLGRMSQEGKAVQRDDGIAIAWFKKAADQGLADAENYLGYMHQNGLGTPKNDTEAVKWYRKAAEKGHAAAQNNLGLMYCNGRGVPKDYKSALEWFHKSAKQRNPMAQGNLGVLYQNGWGVPADRVKAIAWYLKASDQGYELAKQNLRNLGIQP